MFTSVWPTASHPERAPFVVRQVEHLRNAGVQVDVFHVNGRKNPLRYGGAWLQVRRRLAAATYDLVHAQWAQAALAAMPIRLPLVVTFRGSDVEGVVSAGHRYSRSGWLLQQAARLVARFADEAIVVASQLARLLPKREYHVIPSGLDLALFRPGPQRAAQDALGLSPGRRYVLFAAASDRPEKRYSLARAAVANLGTHYRAELVTTSGVNPDQMPKYMNACDVLLLTSTHEGSPNVVKEALACNLPVVSTDVGDVAERIANVDGCVLCKDDDSRTIAAGLVTVLDRAQRVDGRTAVADLDEALLTRRVVNVYERALRRSN